MNDRKSSFLSLNTRNNGYVFTCSVEIVTVVSTFCQPSKRGEVFIKINTAGKIYQAREQTLIIKEKRPFSENDDKITREVSLLFTLIFLCYFFNLF